jgi:putative phosphoesterase
MRLIILSDTHITDRYDIIPPEIIEELKKTDLIIHAGDFISVDLYQRLKSLNPLKAVLGNMDAPELNKFLKEKETFTIQGFKIGLRHGFGKPENLLDNLKKSFDNTYDVVIFGHSHNPFCEKIGNTLYFNPGSPTDKIFAPANSYGVLEIDKTIDARIIKL